MLGALNAQKNVDTQQLIWYGYNLKFKINNTWTIEHNLENRQFWFPNRQHQFISHAKGAYNFENGLQVAPGFTFFQITLPQDPKADNAFTVSELRPHIEASYAYAVSPKLQLQNRAMFEWRYFENDNNVFAFRNYRYRHRVQLLFRLSQKFGFRIYDEIILNLGKKIINNTFDQNRLGVAPQLYLKDNITIELGYLNWFQQQASGQDFFYRHIIQLMVSKRFNFYKNGK